jgi:hypothetical protein
MDMRRVLEARKGTIRVHYAYLNEKFSVAKKTVLFEGVLTDCRLHHEVDANRAFESAGAILFASLAFQRGFQSHCIFGSKALAWTSSKFRFLIVAVASLVAR